MAALRFPARDAVDTAQQFHLELDNDSRLFTRSRYRKAKRMDNLAVALLMLFMAAFGALMALGYAPHAKASPSTEAYADIYGPTVCSVLSEYPTVAGVMGVGQGISEESGFTSEQAGEVIAYSVSTYCPQHMGLLKRFVAVFSSGRQIA